MSQGVLSAKWPVHDRHDQGHDLSASPTNTQYSCLENESQSHPHLSAVGIFKVHRTQLPWEGPLLHYPPNEVQLPKTSLGEGPLGGAAALKSESPF